MDRKLVKFDDLSVASISKFCDTPAKFWILVASSLTSSIKTESFDLVSFYEGALKLYQNIAKSKSDWSSDPQYTSGEELLSFAAEIGLLES